MGQAASRQEEFWEACGFGHWVNVEKFIEEGIDVNWVSMTHNSCPIHVASQGKPEVVRLLLKAKCNVHAEDDRGNTAVHHAAMKGHADIIWMLLDAGCDPNAQDKNGWTPLICSAYYGYPEAVWTLLERGAFRNVRNKDDRNALHEVARSVSNDEEALIEITQYLIDAKLDLNDKSSSGTEADFTPLMFASYHGHSGVAKKLIEAGSDIHACGESGWTALHWAANRGHGDCVELLLESGANANLKTQRGDCALEVSKTNAIKNILASRTTGYEDAEFDVALDRIPIPAVCIHHASDQSDCSDADSQSGCEQRGSPVRILITDRPSVTTDEAGSSSASSDDGDSFFDEFDISDPILDDRSTPEGVAIRAASEFESVVGDATYHMAACRLGDAGTPPAGEPVSKTSPVANKLAGKPSDVDSDYEPDFDEYCDVVSSLSSADEIFEDALGGTEF